MEHIQSGYRSISLILQMNLDRFLVLGVLALAFFAGGYLAQP